MKRNDVERMMSRTVLALLQKLQPGFDATPTPHREPRLLMQYAVPLCAVRTVRLDVRVVGQVCNLLIVPDITSIEHGGRDFSKKWTGPRSSIPSDLSAPVFFVSCTDIGGTHTSAWKTLNMDSSSNKD
jgi:hypothetical protein